MPKGAGRIRCSVCGRWMDFMGSSTMPPFKTYMCFNKKHHKPIIKNIRIKGSKNPFVRRRK